MEGCGARTVNSLADTILVVDDRPASRYPLVHALRRAGFEVMEASTGKEALELSSYLPAVIVLDVKLPDILGYEVCRRIKANANTNQILVLQLSAAFLSDKSKVHALESGADSFLTQPVEPNVLIATVRSLVRLHNAELNNRRLGEQWQTTFDALAEGVGLVDSSGILQRSNRA
jgi:two-component system, NtrC family, sensor kinase